MRVCFFANAPFDIIKVTGFYQNDIKILKELGFEVVVANSFRNIPGDADLYYAFWASSGAKAILFSKIARKPSIVVLGGSDVSRNDPTATGYDARPAWQKAIIRWTLRNANMVLADSKDVYKYAKQLGAKKLKLSYFAVDTEMYKPITNKKKSIAIVVSHLSKQNVERKRMMDIIYAMKEVVKKIPEAKFIFLGTKLDGYHCLQKLTEDLKLEKNIIFVFRPPLSEKEKIKYIQKSKFFVQPSLHEGFGLAMVEAMACALPVVVTRRGATPEVAGGAAVYVTPKKPKELAKTMIKLFKNEKLVQTIGKKARERVLKMYTFERRKRELANVINEVMKK